MSGPDDFRRTKSPCFQTTANPPSRSYSSLSHRGSQESNQPSPPSSPVQRSGSSWESPRSPFSRIFAPEYFRLCSLFVLMYAAHHHAPRWRANPVRGPWPGPVNRLRAVRAARAVRRREVDAAIRLGRQAHRSPRSSWTAPRGARSASMTGARRCSSGGDDRGPPKRAPVDGLHVPLTAALRWP